MSKKNFAVISAIVASVLASGLFAYSKLQKHYKKQREFCKNLIVNIIAEVELKDGKYDNMTNQLCICANPTLAVSYIIEALLNIGINEENITFTSPTLYENLETKNNYVILFGQQQVIESRNKNKDFDAAIYFTNMSEENNYIWLYKAIKEEIEKITK